MNTTKSSLDASIQAHLKKGDNAQKARQWLEYYEGFPEEKTDLKDAFAASYREHLAAIEKGG